MKFPCFRAHRRYGHQLQVHVTAAFVPANREPFASIAVALGSRVTPSLTLKFRLTNSSSLGPFSHLPLIRIVIPSRLTPSSNSSNQTRLTLEPSQPSKKIHTFIQWLSAFNIFVAIFSEEFPNEIPRLIKYSGIVQINMTITM